jgi:hypothetical protein
LDYILFAECIFDDGDDLADLGVIQQGIAQLDPRRWTKTETVKENRLGPADWVIQRQQLARQLLPVDYRCMCIR